MVNYKRVVCEVAVVALLAVAASAAPAPPSPDCHYDQRQNGSENYRLNIDGVVIAVAPADSLLAAASEIDLSDLLDLADYPEHAPSKPDKPQVEVEPKPESDSSKPQEAKPQDAKPEAEKPSDLSNVNVSQNSVKQLRKEAVTRKQEKAQRLKNRLAQFLIPLLRKTRHH